MGRPAERKTPEMLPTATTLPATAAATESEPRRYVLPKDLSAAVKHLSDGELDLMHAATLEEMKRRGRTPQSVEAGSQVRPEKAKSPPTDKRRHVNAAEFSLTRGQVNAVRSAFKAGVTPSRIAREFGIPQSDVRQVLASWRKKYLSLMKRAYSLITSDS